MRPRPVAAAAVLFLLAVLCTAAVARALELAPTSPDEEGNLAVSPPLTEQPVSRGQQLRFIVRIANRSREPVELDIATRDLVAATSPRSLVRPLGRAATRAGTWLEPEVRTLRLPALHQAELAVRVQVPANARPGTHAAGLIVSRRLTARPGTPVELRVRGSVGAVLLLNVEGRAATAWRITRPSAPRIVWHGEQPRLRAYLSNTGDTLVTASGEFEISGFLGTAAQQFPFRDVRTLPDGRRELTARWEEVPWFGWFRPTVTVSDGTREQQRELPMMFVLPPWWLVLLLVLALALPLYVRWRSRREHHDEDEPDAD